MTEPKKTKKKRDRKPKADKEQQVLARRYEMAWYSLYYQKATFAQCAIVEEPHGRHANELAKETRRLAESNRKIEVVGKAEEYLEVSGKFY
jgi:hypothetical protein